MITTIAKGNILIANPAMYDANFDRSVITLVEHNQNGSVGFIQNKPTGFFIKDLLSDLDCNFPVYKGGPVAEDNIYYLHTRPDLIKNSIEIYSGLFWSGDFKQMRRVIIQNKIKETEIRFFLGYSGWSKDQLNKELKDKVWNLLDKKVELAFFQEDKYSVWQKMIKILGGDNLLWINTPFDPTMN